MGVVNEKGVMQVLDKGEVQLIQSMGTDRTVAEAAWVSTDKTENRTKKDVERVIGYMARNNHWTPFGHPTITMRFKMPLMVTRQWMRSTVGIVYNEESRRYVDKEPEFYVPDKWRARGENVKQGSGGDLPVGYDSICDSAYESAMDTALGAYKELLRFGVAPEMARLVLPESRYTEFWQTGSLAAWARVVGLRMDGHAQWETQQYAQVVSMTMGWLFPVSWQALTNKKGD